MEQRRRNLANCGLFSNTALSGPPHQTAPAGPRVPGQAGPGSRPRSVYDPGSGAVAVSRRCLRSSSAVIFDVGGRSEPALQAVTAVSARRTHAAPLSGPHRRTSLAANGRVARAAPRHAPCDVRRASPSSARPLARGRPAPRGRSTLGPPHIAGRPQQASAIQPSGERSTLGPPHPAARPGEAAQPQGRFPALPILPCPRSARLRCTLSALPRRHARQDPP